MYYYGFRFFNFTIRRWISPDPLNDASGMNYYRFCDNSPIVMIDPVGLDTVTYEFVNPSEHGAWYRFWHQPNDTIYVKSNCDILNDLKKRKLLSLTRVNLSSHGEGSGNIDLGDTHFRMDAYVLLSQDFEKLTARQQTYVRDFQKTVFLFKEIEKHMATDGLINLVICCAGRGENGVQLEDYLNRILPFVDVHTWAFNVTFFFKSPMITEPIALPGKFSHGAK